MKTKNEMHDNPCVSCNEYMWEKDTNNTIFFEEGDKICKACNDEKELPARYWLSKLSEEAQILWKFYPEKYNKRYGEIDTLTIENINKQIVKERWYGK